jgi:hypothetical protein
MSLQSEAELLEIYRWMFPLAVALEIVFPVIGLIILLAALDSADPIFFATFVFGSDMSSQETGAAENLVAKLARVSSGVIVWSNLG